MSPTSYQTAPPRGVGVTLPVGLQGRQPQDAGILTEVTRSNLREGYHSVTPRIVVRDLEAQVSFLREVFDATGDLVPGRPAELRIGDSLVMVSPATERDAFAAFLYVYVEDADSTYQRALGAGAETLEAPLDTPYGDRRAMVRDPFGNIFQIAHVLDPS